MNAEGRGRDEEVVRALRAASARRRQARRQRRARIVKVGLSVVGPALCFATALGLRSTCKAPPHVARPTAAIAPQVTPPPAPPICPNDDGLEDDDRVAAITREFEAVPASRLGTAPRPFVTGMIASRDRIARCTHAAPSTRGLMRVMAVVAPDGHVKRARVTGRSLSAAVGRCVAAAVTATGFPPSGGITSEIPYVIQPEQAPSGCPETVTARRLRLLNEAMEEVMTTCAGQRGPEVCAAGEFARTFGERLAIIEQNRATAEVQWLTSLENGAIGAAPGLAWLRSRKALPALRDRLVEQSIHPAGAWEDADLLRQQLKLTAAIEHLSRRPVGQAVKLTAAERRALRDASRVRMTDTCHLPPERMTARWLLHTLDGTPLQPPPSRYPARYRCAPGSSVAIAY